MLMLSRRGSRTTNTHTHTHTHKHRVIWEDK